MESIVKVVLAVVGTIVVILVAAHVNFTRKIDREVRDLFGRADKSPGQIVTADMLQGLPEPVRRCLEYAGVVGKPMVKTARLKQTGRMRQDLQQPWQDLEAEEYYTIDPPRFIWVAAVKVAGIPVVRARDQYAADGGNMLIKMASLFNIADARGTEMDQGSMMRFLQEATWFPSAFLGPNMTWKAIDETSAEVTFTDGGKSVAGTLYVDLEGKVTNFVAKRYRTISGGYSLETWSAPMTEYGEFEGVKVGVRGQGVWNLALGDLPYIDVRVTDLQYDRPELY
jgi:hypothetical protein